MCSPLLLLCVVSPNVFRHISFACLSQLPFLSSWVLNSGAMDHISSSKFLFPKFSTSDNLPKVTLENGSKTELKG
jgi:hypothetical protein